MQSTIMQQAKHLQLYMYSLEPKAVSVSNSIPPQWVATYAIQGQHVYYL